jgi:hypothetical protein
MSDRDAMILFLVYAIVFRPLNIIIYVGSTARTDNFERSDEHSRLRGGARRVTIAFAQSWFQPIINFFEFRELWRGECTTEQAKGIEQFFMNKHETKVTRPRSRESCVAHDIDLMTKGTIPRHLNIVNACTDDSIVEWAATRVAHDSAITLKLSPMEQARTNYAFEVQRIAFETEAAVLSSRVISDCIDKYTSMPLNTRVQVSEFYTDLVRINGSLSVDDGMDVRRCCRAKLLAFNTDHHTDETWSVEFVISELRSIQIALGLPTLASHEQLEKEEGMRRDTSTMVTSTAPEPISVVMHVPAEPSKLLKMTVEETTLHLARMVFQYCKPDPHSYIMMDTIKQGMQNMAWPLQWAAVSATGTGNHTTFYELVKSEFEKLMGKPWSFHKHKKHCDPDLFARNGKAYKIKGYFFPGFALPVPTMQPGTDDELPPPPEDVPAAKRQRVNAADQADQSNS